MTGIRVPQLDERQGDGRQAAVLVGREAEVDRVRAFVATARTDGGALLETGEPGVGKTVLLDAASKARQPPVRGYSVRPAFSPGRDELFRPEPGPSPAEVVRRYGLDADLAGAWESIDTWTDAVVNR